MGSDSKDVTEKFSWEGWRSYEPESEELPLQDHTARPANDRKVDWEFV